MATRRGRGEGSITQLPDGRYQARVDLGYVNGKRQRKVVYGKTRKEAADKLNAALAKKNDGTLVVNESLTVGAFLTRWLEDSVKPTVRPRTYESYRQYSEHHLIPTLGRIRLAKLTAQQVQAMMNEKLQAGLAPRTVQYLRAILRRALGQALKWGLVARNVATLVDPPKVTHQEVQPLSPDEVRTFLAGIRGERLEPLYITAIATGMRQGELLGLRWQDVDLDLGMLRVHQTLQRIAGELVYGEPKSARSRRTISLPAFVVAALRGYRIRQMEERLAKGPDWHDTGLVFTSEIGTALDDRNVTHRFQRTLKRLELRRQRFHDLRHCCATLLLSRGVHPRIVMETLGHSQISLTLNTYSHVMPALQREAADQMESLLGAGV